MSALPRRVALLRGINLGSNRRLAMAELRSALARHGFEGVRTYLQTGNVVFDGDAHPQQAARRLEVIIRQEMGLEVAVVVRTRDELATVVDANPLRAVATDFKRLQVTFLEQPLSADVEKALESADVAPEQLVVCGREIYSWHPYGIARSALNPLLTQRKLDASPTTRNWNTVTKLLALADA